MKRAPLMGKLTAENTLQYHQIGYGSVLLTLCGNGVSCAISNQFG